MIKRFAGTIATRSRAVAHEGVIYAVATAKNKSAPLFEQTKDALAQIDATLAEAGSSNDSSLVQAIRRGGQESVTRAGDQIVSRELGIKPTLTIRPGFPVRVLVTRDLVLGDGQ